MEHQKRNQTATSQWPVGFVFGVQLDYSCQLKSVPPDAIHRGKEVWLGAIHILRNTGGGALLADMSNQVKHLKQNQPAIEKWPFGFVFGVQLGLRQTRALIKTKKNKLLQVEQLWDK